MFALIISNNFRLFQKTPRQATKFILIRLIKSALRPNRFDMNSHKLSMPPRALMEIILWKLHASSVGNQFWPVETATQFNGNLIAFRYQSSQDWPWVLGWMSLSGIQIVHIAICFLVSWMHKSWINYPSFTGATHEKHANDPTWSNHGWQHQ